MWTLSCEELRWLSAVLLLTTLTGLVGVPRGGHQSDGCVQKSLRAVRAEVIEGAGSCQPSRCACGAGRLSAVEARLTAWRAPSTPWRRREFRAPRRARVQPR